MLQFICLSPPTIDPAAVSGNQPNQACVRSGHQLRRTVAVSLVLIVFAMPARSNADDLDPRLTQAKATIDQALAGSSLPGLVIGITDRHALRTVIVHGYSDLKSRTPLTASSRFEIGRAHV